MYALADTLRLTILFSIAFCAANKASLRDNYPLANVYYVAVIVSFNLIWIVISHI